MMTDRWIWTAVIVLFGAMLVLSVVGCAPLQLIHDIQNVDR